MDADLEAILAESDSDDAAGEGGLSLEDILKEDGGASPLQEYRAPTTNEESYSARDWAVLQQILREDPHRSCKALAQNPALRYTSSTHSLAEQTRRAQAPLHEQPWTPT